MPIRKIGELSDKWAGTWCRSPEHNPTMIVLPAGIYEHTCPSCGHIIKFVVPEGPRF